ncbi:MAG: ATP-binding protein [Caldilineaceae bacterium]|nr:ATP-binding protein [Caldilineaceae bacterium]
MHLPTWFHHRKTDRVFLGTKGLFGLSAVSVPLAEYNTHLYIVGQSGSGKSKLLQHLLFEIISNGWGCGVIDPHSDLINDLLAQLHESGWLAKPQNAKRILLLDPSRSDLIVPVNLLKSSFANSYELAENIVEAFRRVWPETLSKAPRFAQILRNTLVVLAENNLSLGELEPFLTQPSLRKNLLAHIADPEIVSFFTNQYNRWGREQVIMAGPVLNKVAAFLFQPPVRQSLSAATNRLDFRTIIDSGTILLADLGGLNGETQQLYGSLLVTSLEQAAMSRRDQDVAERRPFFCMIDEFPFFCSRDASTLARILSEVRKFNCLLGLAHQTVAQTDQRMQGALENAKLKCVFATGRDTANALARQLLLPNPDLIKHEVVDDEAQERSHPLYETLMNQLEMGIQRLMRLKKRHMLVKLPERDTLLLLRTPNAPTKRTHKTTLEQVKSVLIRQAAQEISQPALTQRQNADEGSTPPVVDQSSPAQWKESLWHEPKTEENRA